MIRTRPSPGTRLPAHCGAGALVVALALTLTACATGSSARAAPPPSRSAATPRTPPKRENVAFYYQRIPRRANLEKLGRVSIVVTGKTADARSVRAIKRTGAKAYRSVQAYWFTTGDSYDGMEVPERLEWAFCLQGRSPLVARTDGRGNPWYFLDANERPVRDLFAARLRALKAEGWDGVFFDRGYAATTGYDETPSPAWNSASTCTQAPVQRGATLADAYVGMASEVKKAGLELMMNYGVSPFDARTPMRADPRDPACAPHPAAKCKTLDDVWPHVDSVLDEAAAHARDDEWDNDYRSNALNEKNAKQGRQVVGLLTNATMGGQQTRGAVLFGWARVKLFVVPLGVNTGDDNCGNPPPGTLCNRHGLYPELANIAFGDPLARAPRSLACSRGSRVHCLWVRRYRQGMSLLNVSRSRKRTGRLDLGVRGCRYVKDVGSGRPLGRNRCVDAVSLELAAWSGHPLVYSHRPW